MEIPNLTNQPQEIKTDKSDGMSLPVVLSVIFISLFIGFWASRFFPLNKTNSNSSTSVVGNNLKSTDNISQASQLKVGTVYGTQDPTCKDTATGTVEQGSINGEGTHILNRPGGADQRASLLSSAVDLDLFVGKKVDITGQTNSSKKTGWLLDVCSIKITE